MERTFSIKTVQYKWTFISIGICLLVFVFPQVNAWIFYSIGLSVLFFFSYIPANRVNITLTDKSISGIFNEFPNRNSVSKEIFWSDIKSWKLTNGNAFQTFKITTNDNAIYKINASVNFMGQKEFREMISLFEEYVNLFNINNPEAGIEKETSIWS